MALQLRPNCELCDCDLPAGSAAARICSYECTFCAACVDGVLRNVCPNCGGGFVPRPIRPKTEWRPGLSLEKRPASGARVHKVHTSFTKAEIEAFAQKLSAIAPRDR